VTAPQVAAFQDVRDVRRAVDRLGRPPADPSGPAGPAGSAGSAEELHLNLAAADLRTLRSEQVHTLVVRDPRLAAGLDPLPPSCLCGRW
jgi:hypothetical protein